MFVGTTSGEHVLEVSVELLLSRGFRGGDGRLPRPNRVPAFRGGDGRLPRPNRVPVPAVPVPVDPVSDPARPRVDTIVVAVAVAVIVVVAAPSFASFVAAARRRFASVVRLRSLRIPSGRRRRDRG